MSHYLISIGGSGARAAEAFVYLCAAGLGPGGKATLVFVDPDESNHSVKRALDLISLYQQLREIKRGDGCPLFATEIALAKPAPWTPFKGFARKPTLENYFQAQTLRAQSEPDSMLFEFLYDQSQRTAELDIGFRGRPSIGAAVFADQLNSLSTEPWRSLAGAIATEATRGPVHIFAVGSVFGGTGAAGLPTIPKLLGRDGEGKAKANVVKGACLLLPYFSFATQNAGDQVFARPDGFALNAKAAVRFYAVHEKDYRRVYVVGAESPVVQKTFSLGGGTQTNDPSYVELLAALAARDFYAKCKPSPEGRDVAREVAIISRHEKDRFSWKDVPDSGDVHPALGQFTRMSYGYLARIIPKLEEIRTAKDSWFSLSNPHRTAWYVNLVKGNKVNLEEKDIKDELAASLLSKTEVTTGTSILLILRSA